MLKLVVFFSVLFSGLPTFSQVDNPVDNKVRNYPEFNSIEALSIRIQNDFQLDSDRIRAAFVWLAENIIYDRTLDDLFAVAPKLFFYSDFGKNHQIEAYRLTQIHKAFDLRKGVCSDYSFLLHYLCKSFHLNSRVIPGLSKTDITDGQGNRLVKNHTWNAVFFDNQWHLMDPTWAAGYFDTTKGKYIKKFTEHYFRTNPDAFIKTHFPAQQKWQLLKHPIDLNTFFSAPIFFPQYFKSTLKLSENTKGILKVSGKAPPILVFDTLPGRRRVFYRIEGEQRMRKMKFRKKNSVYLSHLKLHKRGKGSPFVTVFLENQAILNFKVLSEGIN